jgi:glycosyltransferase involved in cell wall biosynthesis
MAIPKVSIVMAAYNGEPYLAATIQSILDQTFTDFEFIVVDDGSTDDTWKTLTRFAERDTRIVLLRNQPNAGVVRSLNRGLDYSRGSIIARQDADDISHPERIQKQLGFLDANPEYGLVAAVPQPIDIAGNPLDLSYWNGTENEEIQHKLLENMCLCGPTIMVRRECLEAVGFYFSEGSDASEDYDLCLRLAEVTKLASLGGSLYLYRQHPESASSKRAQKQMFNKAIALERAIHRRYGKNPPQDKVALVARDYLHAAVIGFARQDLAAARSCLDRAIEVYPPLLDIDQPLEELVRAYTPVESVDAALQYTVSIFEDLLPKTRRLAHMKSRLLSYLHMGEVFSRSGQQQYWRVRSHLWTGIRHNPAWLLNRGVISIALKSLFGRSS